MRKIYPLVLLLTAVLLTYSSAYSQGVEYIIQYDDGTSNFYSGRPDPNDTCGVWFEPPTESEIISGQFQFNGGMGGLADVYIWGLTSDFDPEDYWDTDEASGVPGPSPLDTVIAGPIEYDFDNRSEEQWPQAVRFGYSRVGGLDSVQRHAIDSCLL